MKVSASNDIPALWLSTAFEISMNSVSPITFVTFFVHYNTNPNGPKDTTVIVHTAD